MGLLTDFRDQTKAGIARHACRVAEIDAAREMGMSALISASAAAMASPEEQAVWDGIAMAWKDMKDLQDEELAHLDKVAEWLMESTVRFTKQWEGRNLQ